MLYFTFLSFCAGVAIATQANINSKLSVFLTNPLLATSIALISSFVFTCISIPFLVKEFPSVEMVKSIPIYLWFSGGMLSAFALTSFYFAIPKIGTLSMISFGLAGQLTYSLFSSHFGWFDLPVSQMSINKIVGIIAALVGIYLINKG